MTEPYKSSSLSSACAKGHGSVITQYLDKDIGALLDLLERKGLSENTLIVFASDNGPHEECATSEYRATTFDSSNGLKGVKRSIYEGGLRSPTIVSLPGTIPGGQSRVFPSTLYDLPATVLDFVGQSFEEFPYSHSLKELIVNGKEMLVSGFGWSSGVFVLVGLLECICTCSFQM